MGQLVHFGCETRKWRSTIQVSRGVRNAIKSDDTLFPVLYRALNRHERTLPQVLRFDQKHETVVWKERGTGYDCVISTYCHRKGGIETLIGMQGGG